MSIYWVAFPGARSRDSVKYLQNAKFYRAMPVSRVVARSRDAPQYLG